MSFYDILLEELSNSNTTNHDNICLITKDKLQDNFVTLNCGHTFNYLSLYNELLKQKANSNYFEIVNIKINETKCPYCRQVTPKILPYIHMDGVNIVKGVTSPKIYSMKLNDCEWIFLNGKKKGTQCKCSAIKTETGIFCKLHETIILKKKNKNNIDNTDKTKHTDNIDKTDNTDKTDNSNKTKHTDNIDNTNQTDKTKHTDNIDNTNHNDITNQTDNTNIEELTNICKKYTISILKFFLKTLHLKVTGTKSQLIERLVYYNLNNPNNPFIIL